jgi:hypothetical protein
LLEDAVGDGSIKGVLFVKSASWGWKAVQREREVSAKYEVGSGVRRSVARTVQSNTHAREWMRLGDGGLRD